MRQHKQLPLVLCEGKEDRFVMEMLAASAGLDGKLKFEDYDGESNLRAYLGSIVAGPEYGRGEYSKILVIRDADTSYASAWQSVTDAIQAVFEGNIDSPDDMITSTKGVEISAWVVPGPEKTGMIETLCLEASRSSHADLFTCLDPLISCLTAKNGIAPHEKIRFALWTMIAQGPTAKDRLSVKYALANIPLDWNSEIFRPLRELLIKHAS